MRFWDGLGYRKVATARCAPVIKIYVLCIIGQLLAAGSKAAHGRRVWVWMNRKKDFSVKVGECDSLGGRKDLNGSTVTFRSQEPRAYDGISARVY